MSNLPVESNQTTSSLALLRPIASPQDLIAYHQQVTDLIQGALKFDVDYGVIPGTGTKPVLLKPGAERLCLAFGAAPTYECVEQDVDHDHEVKWTKRKKQWNNKFKGDRSFEWVEESGISFGRYRYVYKCRIVREGRVLAEGVGTCSTLESKYVDRPRDCENTVCKMAQKRAFLSATLHAFALSDRFTCDVEDSPELYQNSPPSENPAPQTTQQRQGATKAKPSKDYAKPKETPPPKEEPRPAPRTASIYSGTPDQQNTLMGILKAQKVPQELWEEIGRRLTNLPSTELKNIVAQVTADAKAEGPAL